MPPAMFSIDSTIADTVCSKCDLTVIHIPPAIFIFSQSTITEVQFTLPYIPPAMFIMHDSGKISLYPAIFQIIPCSRIIIQSCVSTAYFRNIISFWLNSYCCACEKQTIFIPCTDNCYSHMFAGYDTMKGIICYGGSFHCIRYIFCLIRRCSYRNKHTLLSHSCSQC